MNHNLFQTFSAHLEIIGINPFVSLPKQVLEVLFSQAQKEKSPIPIKGTINGKAFKQTLVKFRGVWRLYINTSMLKDSPKRIGEFVEISVSYDSEERIIHPHPKLVAALDAHPKAKQTFNELPTYLQKEIIRYISSLKQERSIDQNVVKAIGFLEGKNRFVGREPKQI